MRVLLALDGTEASGRAASFVDELIAQDDREITTVHVQSSVPPEVFGWAAPSGIPGRDAGRSVVGPDICEHLAVERRAVESASAQAPLDSDVEVRYGDPANVIIGAAEHLDVDLIVVGSHDRSLIDRLLSGSVSAKVARKAHQPVLIVR